MKFKLFICVLFFINLTDATAQSFKWSADLEKVPANGFYSIGLSPEIISKTANKTLADIRIYENKKEIAYLLRQLPDSIYLKDTVTSGFQYYTIVPTPSISVKEDKANKRTVVSINFNEAYQIDKLLLNLEGFRYYRRTAWLSETNPIEKNKKSRYSDERLINITISSEKQTTIDIYGENRYKQLFLVIENEDSRPLLIKNIDAYQKNMILITYLEKDKQYVIKTGQLEVELPRYDLSYFSDSIGSDIAAVRVLDFKVNRNEAPEKHTVLIKKGWMWAALGVLIVFLGYLSYFMVKDMQQKKDAH